MVRALLDLSAMLKSYTTDRGVPPYDPTRMVALLLDAYSQGRYASRRLAEACEERVDVMAVTARQRPALRTISDFRKRHRSALGGLFTPVLQLCQKAGMGRLGHVALDGTTLRANAATPKAMSSGRRTPAEPALAAEGARWLAEATASDAREAAATGARKAAPKTRVHATKSRRRRAGWRSRSRRRKQVVAPVFGQITQARGFRQFVLRGLAQVAAEWRLVRSAHTVLQLAGARG